MEISIIVPTLNEAANIGRLLDQLLSDLSLNFEIIVVDGGSTDDTLSVCNKRKIRVIQSPPSRAIQQNVGAKHAKHPYLYFLHADTLPPATLQKDLESCMKNDVAAACYRSKYDSKSLLLKVNAFFTRFYWLVARGGDQSLLIKKDLFHELGGFDEKFVIMEEYPLIEKLMKTKQLTILKNAMLISTRKYKNRSWMTVSRANYRAFKLFKNGVDSKIIRKVYEETLNS